MNLNDFWNIIDNANKEAGLKNRETMLKHTESQLFQLPSAEIVEWFNIHHFYLDLAENKVVEKAASDCGLYLSDDSFLYFRGWLLSLGKEAFYSVLNHPETLSDYVSKAGRNHTRFESFVYAGHEVYTKKAFLEEYGEEGSRNYREQWLSDNPDKEEYGFEWALGNRYSLWEASAQSPLHEDQKEEIQNDLFSVSKDKTIEVIKTQKDVKQIEQVLLDMFPNKSTDYRNLSIYIYSGYESGFGMLPAASEAFHREMKKLFTNAGWEYHEPVFLNACPEYSKGNSRLYCHPTEISGPCDQSLISEVCTFLSKAVTCTITKAADKGRIYDITDEEYLLALESLRPEIEETLLKIFSLPNSGSDSTRHEKVMMRYQVATLEHHSGLLSSRYPYWSYTEEVLKDLISQGKIIERPEAKSFSSWTYITAPEYNMAQKTDLTSQIKHADLKSCNQPLSPDEKIRKADPER